MKFLHASPARAVDIAGITATIERALSAAGLPTQTGPMHDVTATIRRALESAGMAQTPGASTGAGPGPDATVIDVTAREIDSREIKAPEVELREADSREAASREAGAHGADAHKASSHEGSAREVDSRKAGSRDIDPRDPREPAPPQPAGEPATPGQFVTRTFRNAAGMRRYKLFVPTGDAEAQRPLVVMLHGCKQSPDDFAAGTQMNRLAQAQGFIVVYPEQTANDNGSNCWNWFQADDQARDRGEPSLIAGITREVAASHAVDPRRIYVAGLSAGAAMAVILGETYPELYAGVGAHSGLPYAAAHDIPSAFAAMSGGRAGMPDLANLPGMPDLANLPGMPDLANLPGMPDLANLPGMPDLANLRGLPDLANLPGLATWQGAATLQGVARMPDLPNLPGLSSLPGGAAAAPRQKAQHFVPTIVFHGDKDHTVGLGNGTEIVAQATDALARKAGEPLPAPSTQSGASAGGRRYSRTVHTDAQGHARVESWVVHGAGHAWAGGHASGSFTDGSGPDASSEMIRFFLAQPQGSAA